MSESRKPVLFVNPKSGAGGAVRAAVPDLARQKGVDVLVLQPEQRLAELVAEAVAGGADALGVAGGDGSLAVVAAAACKHGLPFVCVPTGTRNHFALDLGLDRHDIVGALDAFTDGVERRIDVAEVNGRLFLNNVSLGIYGEAVRQAAYRDAKVRTLLQTAERVLGPAAEVHDLQLVDDGERVHRRPAVVLVSNNPYAPAPPFPHGTRPTLDSGRLGVVILDTPRPGRPPRARLGDDRPRGHRSHACPRRNRRGGVRSRPAAAVHDPATRVARARRPPRLALEDQQHEDDHRKERGHRVCDPREEEGEDGDDDRQRLREREDPEMSWTLCHRALLPSVM